MRSRAAIIIKRENRILAIHRFKNGREYYVIPGGGIKSAETPQEAAIREIMEETSLNVNNLQEFWQFNNQGQSEYYFYSNDVTGTPCFGGPELKKISADNTYRLCWLSKQEITNLPLMPPELKPKLLQLF